MFSSNHCLLKNDFFFKLLIKNIIKMRFLFQAFLFTVFKKKEGFFFYNS